MTPLAQPLWESIVSLLAVIQFPVAAAGAGRLPVQRGGRAGALAPAARGIWSG
jgi:hypothetical protein